MLKQPKTLQTIPLDTETNKQTHVHKSLSQNVDDLKEVNKTKTNMNLKKTHK